MKKITLLIVFLLSVMLIEAQTYVDEDFDTEIPATWTVTDEGAATDDSWISGQKNGQSLDGSNGALVDSDANGNGTQLIETLTSPVFDATSAVNLFLDFDQYYQNIGADSAIVEVFDGTTWIEVLNQTATIGIWNNPNQQHINLTAYANANMQVRFVYNDGNTWAWQWMVDNVLIYNSTCNFPSEGVAGNINVTTADLSWTPGGSESSWEIINQEQGGPSPTDADSGTATTENPYQVSDLVEGTNYEFYVRADCGADGTSLWAGPFTYRVSGPGETCEAPIMVTTPLPYVTTDNTSNYINDYGGSPGADCGSTFGYLNGDDVVYAYSPDSDTSVDIELSEITDNYTGVFVYTDCANIGTACETGATNSFSLDDLLIDNFTVLAGETYYIVISTWAAPQTTGYTLTITENTCIDPEANFEVVSDCVNGPQFFVDVDVTNLGSAGSVTVTDDQGSTPETVTATGVVTFGPYANNTPVIFTLENDDDANCLITSAAQNQEFCLDTVVDCNAGPISAFYCYSANDTNQFSYTSTDGSPIRLTIDSGQVEGAPFDFLVILDSDGVTELYNGEGNDGDISGLTFQSTGDTIFFQITSDGSVSCQNGFGDLANGIAYTVTCATCVNPQATFEVVGDCLVAPQFFVDVDITDIGSATSLTVTDNQGSTAEVVSAAGIVTFGPYVNNTNVQITIANDDDVNCVISSNTLTQEICLENLVDCTAGPVSAFYCYESNDTNLFSYTSSDGNPLNLTFNSGEIEGAPFDFLVVLDSDGVTELYNDEGNDGDLSGLTFQSTGDTIFFQITSDGSVACQNGFGDLANGLNYTVSCATCINPAASYQIIDDCDNGEQFLIDVNITTLGDATSLTISNNLNGDTTPVTATGVYQVGPFPFLTDVVITVSNDQDVNCVINSSAIQLAACPPDNDNPCNATVVGVNEGNDCDIIASGTLLEATPSGIAPGTCTGNANDDVWFQFVATSEVHLITFDNIDSSGFFEDLDHAVYSGSCDTPIEVYCSTANASVTPELVVGETYFIRVFSAGADPVDYTFDLCIRPGTGNVSVDQDTYTVEELVTDVLIGLDCAEITNITFSTGTNFGSTNGIGYFSAGEGDFPFTEGLLLTTGDASRAGGPNVNTLSDGGFNWPGDADLDGILDGSSTTNASIIEFDFVAYANEISFDFLMASEEYNGSTGGSFECNFSDAFAFLLTDEDGVTTNLAVLPGTTTPILVTNIHPENPGCAAINEEYFGGYTPQNLPPISFDGRTTVFTAFSEVNLGDTYHIKLVIGDASQFGGDTAFDSGVFLKAGSFDIGQIDLGADITVEAGTATCDNQPNTIQTTADNVAHVWFKDGFVIEGETTNVLTVTEAGTYTVQIIFSSQCIVSDEIIVEFLPTPEIPAAPDDIFECAAGDIATFDLDENNASILGEQSPNDFTITHYPTEEDANNGTNPLMSPYTNISNPQVIYVRLENNITGCFSISNFNLIISDPVAPGVADDLFECSATNTAIFDLTQNDDAVLGGQAPGDFIITYHASEDDANNDTGALNSPYTNVSNPQVIYVRLESAVSSGCYSVSTFNIATEAPTHTAASIEYAECDNEDDGFADFNLESQNANVLNGQDPAQYIVTYHATQADADSGANDLVSPYESTGETIFVRVESVNYAQCYVTNTMNLVFGIDPVTSFTEDFDYEVCPDATSPILIEATPENYDVSEVSIRWFRDGQPDPIDGETSLTLPVLEGDTYTIEVTFNETGCLSYQDIDVITLESCVIPQGISPGNNDGLNDEFDLSNFRVAKIEIFNRYGTQVFEKNNYTDEWYGQDMNGNELPVGTYFYSILFEDGERTTGWVYVQREK